MAKIISYSPQGIIDKALFNFDEFGSTNYRLSGVVTVSISQPFTYSQYLNGYGDNTTWTPDVAAVYWNATQVSNINSMLAMYSSFANISFSNVVDNTLYSPSGVGWYTDADINISMIYRTDLSWSGRSALDSNSFNYVNSKLDILLNNSNYGSANYSFSTLTFGGHVLMHEIGHSLGLSHPHIYSNSYTRVLSSDFIATTSLGFHKLGFVINSSKDMDQEYFTIMSYDSERPANNADTYAQTPMILDVIALQNAYGIGSGSSGNGNDTIKPGSSGVVNSYRTYFDTGGIDLVDLENYLSGAYLNMGSSIVGASYLVGVSMSMADHSLMIAGYSPQSLRWFYGDFEKATGSIGNDLIIGNSLGNFIQGNAGNDTMYGGPGNDIFDWDVSLRSGKDSMYGGSGDDEYLIDNINDTVIELENEGKDLIWTNLTYSLATINNVESLYLLGTNNINAIGNSLDNFIRGNDGNNIIDGGAGFDTILFSSLRSGYSIKYSDGIFTINGGQGIDIVKNVEYFKFSDTNFSSVELISLLSPSVDVSVSPNEPYFVNMANSFIRGTAFIDKVVFASNTTNFIVRISNIGVDIVDKTSKLGTTNITNVERLKFTDTNLALDLGPSENAGITAKVLGAVFGKDSLSNKTYVGIGLNLLDSGTTYENLAVLALDAAGAKTKDQIVSLLWKNIIGTTASTDDKASYIALLDNGMTTGAFAKMAADTSFNAANINLVGLAQTGIEYF